MGLNFRKSIKIAPGVKLNLGKKSAGISMGGKYGGLSYNTKTGAKARVSAPGTGISYTAKLNNDKNAKNFDNSNNLGTSNDNPDNKKPKKGGCIWILLIPLICLIGYIFSDFILQFGWMVGIIWFIFFRKKNSDNPSRKKTYLISILTVISFLIMLGNMFGLLGEDNVPPNTESLVNTEISSEVILDTETDESEINSETNSEIINTENNVDLNTEQTSESNSENKQSVTDSSSEEAPTNTQPLQNQQPTTDSSSEDTPVVIPPQEEPTPSQTPSGEPVQEPEKSTMVWIPQSGSKYHSHSGCSNMKNPRQVTEESAINMGYDPCKRCY